MFISKLFLIWKPLMNVVCGSFVLFCFAASPSEIAPAFLWTNSVVVTNTFIGDRATGADVALDHAGRAYVSGFFYGTAYFGPTNLTSPGNLFAFPSQANLFVAKYDASGKFRWVRQIAGDNLGFFGSVVFDDERFKAKSPNKTKPHEPRSRNEGDLYVAG